MSTENHKPRLQDTYPYHLVEFISRGRKPQQRKLDIVATKWMSYDNEKKKVLVSNPSTPSPYSSEEYDQFLNELQDPAEDWILYTVKIIGKAVSFGQALEKFKKLNECHSVLTMSSNESDSEAEKKAAISIKQDQLREIANKKVHTYKNLSLQKKGQTGSGSQLNETSLPTTPDSFESTINSLDHHEPENHLKSHMLQVQQRKEESRASITSKSSDALYPLRKTLSDLSNLNNGPKPFQANHAIQAKGNQLVDCQSVDSKNIQGTLNKIYHDGKLIQDMMLTIQSDIKEMKKDIKIINAEIQTMKNSYSQKAGTRFIGTVEQLKDIYSLDIPLKTKEEFLEFNEKIGTDTNFHEHVGCVLETGIDPTLSIPKSIVVMMKMFLTKAVAMQYVAVKKIENKEIMKNTQFFKLIEVIIKERRKLSQMNTSDKEILTALSNVLSNAVAWQSNKGQDSKRKSNRSDMNPSLIDKEDIRTDPKSDIQGNYTVEILNNSDEPPIKILRKYENLSIINYTDDVVNTSSGTEAHFDPLDNWTGPCLRMNSDNHINSESGQNEESRSSTGNEFDEDYLTNYSF